MKNGTIKKSITNVSDDKQIKNKLAKAIKLANEKGLNIKFWGFNSFQYFDEDVIAVTSLNKTDNTYTVAFAFKSVRDKANKNLGKLTALNRLLDFVKGKKGKAIKFVKQVKYNGEGLMCIAHAYNSIAEHLPLAYENSKMRVSAYID